MNERPTTGQPVKNNSAELAEDTLYYTIKGKQDYFDENDNPVQDKENRFTYAKASGRRKMIRINDHGELMNPAGLYNDKYKMDRWAQANEKAFASYLDFLRTKNEMYLRHAIRHLT